jgi:AraC-like DNA-binding protein
MKARQQTEPLYISKQVKEARRFYFGMDVAPADGLVVICGGWERVLRDYTINRDSFPWLGLEFVAGGRGLLRMGGETHRLERGWVFAYGPGVAHQIETDADELLSKYYLNFTGREAADLLSGVMMMPGTCWRAENSGELEETLEMMILDGIRSRPQSPLIAALQLRTFLLKLSGDGLFEGESDRRAQQTFRRSLAYIDQNFLEIATVEKVAEVCHVSPSHLTRLFIRFGYGPPHRYLTRKKMVHAAALLDSGRLLGREVADLLGIDAFQFSRVFKRVHGISPSDFVKRHGTKG